METNGIINNPNPKRKAEMQKASEKAKNMKPEDKTNVDEIINNKQTPISLKESPKEEKNNEATNSTTKVRIENIN